jgi:hypothetical protein
MVNYVDTHAETSGQGHYVDSLFELAESNRERNIYSWEKASLYYYLVATEQATKQQIYWLFAFLKGYLSRAIMFSDKTTAIRLKEAFRYVPDETFRVLAIDTFFSYVHKYEENALMGFPLTKVVGWKSIWESNAAKAITTLLGELEVMR